MSLDSDLLERNVMEGWNHFYCVICLLFFTIIPFRDIAYICSYKDNDKQHIKVVFKLDMLKHKE